MNTDINQKNYKYLTETFANLGFGNFFDHQLKTKMQLGLSEIKLLGDNPKTSGEFVRYAPNLSRSKNEEYGNFYFLNSITATAHDNQNNVTATAEFKIFKKSGFSIQEMENLLAGRPVYRELQNGYNDNEGKWYKLDFVNVNENGMAQITSYPDRVTKLNVDRELDKLNIVWSDKSEREEAIRDLKSGERISAIAKEKSEARKISIEVAAQLGGLAIFDSEGKIIKYTNSQAHSMKNVDEPQQSNNLNQANLQNVDGENTNAGTTKATKVMDALNNGTKESKGTRHKVS